MPVFDEETGLLVFNPYELPADTFAYNSMITNNNLVVDQSVTLPDETQTAALAAIQEKIDWHAAMGTTVTDERITGRNGGNPPTIFTGFSPSSGNGVDTPTLFTTYGHDMAYPNDNYDSGQPDAWPGNWPWYPNVYGVYFANYPADQWLPQLLGLGGDPPDDLAYIGSSTGTTAGGPPSPTVVTVPMPQFPGPAPMQLYVAGVWTEPPDFSEMFWSAIPGGMFTFTGNTWITFDVSSPATVPITGGVVTLICTSLMDFSNVTNIGYQKTDGSVQGAFANFNVDDSTHITVTTDDLSAIAGISAGPFTIQVYDGNQSMYFPQPAPDGSTPANLTLVAPNAQVTGFSPTSGPIGTEITLTGTGLSQVSMIGMSTAYGDTNSAVLDSFTVVDDTTVTGVIPDMGNILTQPGQKWFVVWIGSFDFWTPSSTPFTLT